MLTAVIIFIAQEASKENIASVIEDGEVINVAGLLNLKWEDFCALALAREAGFAFVEWEATRDDTPSNLTLTVRYPFVSAERITTRLREEASIDYFKLQ